MATLTIRNLSDKVRDRLRVRAAKRGVSMEAEARAILTCSVEAPARKPQLSVAELQRWIGANRKKPGADAEAGSAGLIRDRRREAILDILREGQEPAEVLGANYKRVLAEAGWTERHVRGLRRPAR